MSKDIGAASHKLVIVVPFVYAAYYGTRLWLFDPAHAAMGSTARGRLYGADEDGFRMTRFMFGVQASSRLCPMIHRSGAGCPHPARCPRRSLICWSLSSCRRCASLNTWFITA
eukprot:scaffold30222_cov101-Isochrysis_galbana.AAC.1